MQKIIKIIGLVSLGLCMAVFASASETTGNLNTGLGGGSSSLEGNVIAAPVAYWALQSWLNDFAYRVDLGVEVFVAAVIISVIIAILTVSYRAIKAATANPTEALKYE